MKNKSQDIIVIFFISLLLSSLTAGLNHPGISERTTMARDWTILEGIITRHRHIHMNGGEYVEFNAIFLHYSTHWFGNIRSGFFHHFEKIVLPAFHYGYLGAHVVIAKFDMGLAPY